MSPHLDRGVIATLQLVCSLGRPMEPVPCGETQEKADAAEWNYGGARGLIATRLSGLSTAVLWRRL